MEFYGREEEQKAINYILNKDGFQSGIIYGRKRLGKIELLKHCFYKTHKPFIIYQCNQENEKSNIKDLIKLIKENIINLLSWQFFHLLSEITLNIKEELTKINNAYTVFSSIAVGAFHYTDILSKSGINTTSSLYDTLEVLEKMDLIIYISNKW